MAIDQVRQIFARRNRANPVAQSRESQSMNTLQESAIAPLIFGRFVGSLCVGLVCFARRPATAQNSALRFEGFEMCRQTRWRKREEFGELRRRLNRAQGKLAR